MEKNRKIPFELADGIILIAGSVNGTDGHFAFDTGATQTVLNKAYCGAERESDGAARNAITFDDSMRSSEITSAGDASIVIAGKVQTLSAPAMMDMGYVETPLRTVMPDLRFLGSIGADLMGRKKLLIDYKKRFIEPNVETFPAMTQRVDMKVGPLPLIELDIGGNSYDFVLDTGANHFAMHSGSAPMERLVPEPGGSGLFTIPELGFAGSVYENVNGVVTDLSSMRGIIPADGIIGWQLLKDRVCGFDFENGCLYLRQ